MAVDRVMTPSGRQVTEPGNPPGRPPGPTQHLIPVGPPPTYSGVPLQDNPPMIDPRTGRRVSRVSGRIQQPSAQNTAAAHQMLVGFPRINSPLIDPATANATIPWTQFLTNLWRL